MKIKTHRALVRWRYRMPTPACLAGLAALVASLVAMLWSGGRI